MSESPNGQVKPGGWLALGLELFRQGRDLFFEREGILSQAGAFGCIGSGVEHQQGCTFEGDAQGHPHALLGLRLGDLPTQVENLDLALFIHGADKVHLSGGQR